MTTPTPSLPASIREALDAYANAFRRAMEQDSIDGESRMYWHRTDTARTALEAHLLALVEKAEAFDRLESRPPTWDEIETAKRRDARIAVERETAALTPPEDTTPHA